MTQPPTQPDRYRKTRLETLRRLDTGSETPTDTSTYLSLQQTQAMIYNEMLVIVMVVVGHRVCITFPGLGRIIQLCYRNRCLFSGPLIADKM